MNELCILGKIAMVEVRHFYIYLSSTNMRRLELMRLEIDVVIFLIGVTS